MTMLTVNEEQMMQLVRNALLAAGQEMGQGDQWPVIKDTIFRIAKDYEDLKTERQVDEALKAHLYTQIKEMEKGLSACTADLRATLEPKIAELRDLCDAYFSDLDPNAIFYDAQQAPDHIQRMNVILDQLEDNDDA